MIRKPSPKLFSFYRNLSYYPIRLLIACCVLIFSVQVDAQVQKVTGKVVDSTGNPISNVSVEITSKRGAGTMTNQNGEFTINATLANEIEFSAVGFSTLKVKVTGETMMVRLMPVTSALEEVVVVGYGTKRKIDLTGSISTVDSKTIENRPVTNLSSSLAGQVAGAYIYQTSGTPGSDGASIQIRGNSTLSSTAPLILIDGIIGSINSVNPQDVESVTVLKDASSVAIYGAQGANGVILVTTKKGIIGPPTISYTGTFSQVTPTGVPKFVTNSAQYLQLMNEGYTNVGQALQFQPDSIQLFVNAQKNPNGLTPLGVPNYVAYPNTDWSKVVFQHNLLQNHNVSVNGGGNGTTYLLSMGYLHDPGLVASSGYEKYQFRFNLESKVGKYITIGTATYGSQGYYGMFDAGNLFNFLVQGSPTTYPYYKGKYGSTAAFGDKIGQAQNLLYFTKNYIGSSPETYINTTWYGKVKLLKGLSFEPRFNYTIDNSNSAFNDNPVASERWNFATMSLITLPTTPANLSTYSRFNKSYSYTLESVLRYNTTLANNHHLSGLLAFNQYYSQSYGLSVQGKGLIDPAVSSLNTVSSFPVNPSDSYSDWAMRSVFGRINYDYKDKYLLEVNWRNDASSRFGPLFRHGNFPSVSAGWVLSKESFMSSLQDANIQSLKLRASWGKSGNANIGNYAWQATYGIVNNVFAGVVAPGLAVTRIANNSLHWETTEQTDLGFDVLSFNKLEINFDWFRKYTTGILFTAPLDATVGTASAPLGNFAQVGQNGIELNVIWRESLNKFSYSVGGNLTFNYQNKVLQYKGPLVAGWTKDDNGNPVYNSNIGAVSAGGNNRVLEGHMINEFYLQTVYRGSGNYNKTDGSVDPSGGPKDGMIRTQKDYQWVLDMQAAGYQFAQGNPNPNLATDGSARTNGLYYGDLIYADNNGDKIFGNANDAKFMNINTSPKFIFGIVANASWNGFDFSMLWAAASGKKYYWNQTYFNSTKIGIGGQIPLRIAENHYYYDPNNTYGIPNNVNAKFPRLKQSDAIDNIASDFWFYDASYAKLKNLSIGYTFSVDKWGGTQNYIKGLRLYVSGENLLTITKYPGPDPEAGTGVNYPLLRQFAVGVNLRF